MGENSVVLLMLFLGGVAAGYFIFNKGAAKSTGEYPGSRHLERLSKAGKMQVSEAEIASWAREYLDEYKKELLGFYVNRQMRAHDMELSEQDMNQLVNTYGRKYGYPELYIYAKFQERFPSAKEQQLDDILARWLQNYPPQQGSLSAKVRGALEPELKAEAESIIKQKLENKNH